MSKIYVTRPYLPEFSEYVELLQQTWKTGTLTNRGKMHETLEHAIQNILQVRQLSLINNGTIALQIALGTIPAKGRVITTPYSFVATANAIVLSGREPVFVDIADGSFNLDPELIADVDAKDVAAVMPVHVYGLPCDRERIEQGVEYMRNRTQSALPKVFYDAAHAFNVKQDGETVLNWGDMSILSFHATKVFHTFEGGAIVSSDPETKSRIDQLRNFGYNGHGDVDYCGTNGKMNEAQAAMGLLMLDHMNEIISKRRMWYELYMEELARIGGIGLPRIPADVEHNFAYFPIMVESGFPLTRDELFSEFLKQDIFPRKYFFPLITDFSLYQGYKIISRHKVPNARRAADSVICLPLYPDLTESDVDRVCAVIILAGKRRKF